MPPAAEQLFDRYRRRGDLQALGDVFDHAAPALLRVALHVAKDPPTAEDLVQETFLKAIEAAGDWQASRPLIPWLTGILRHLGQQRRWRDARTPDPDRLRHPRPQDPAARVSEHELTEALDAAIDELPEQYRPVLRLSLGYGHHAAEIAHALDRPAATIRGQLARGLTMLRRKLPSGFVAALGLAFVHERGLAAVRTRVLELAPQHLAYSGAAALPTGVLLMKKSLAAIVAIALVALGSWFAWQATASATVDPATTPRGELATPLEATGEKPTTNATKPGADAADRREATLANDATPTDPTLGGLIVRVRWRDGTPANNVAVQLTTDRPLYHHVARQTTNDHGVAHFRDLEPCELTVMTHRGGRAEATTIAGEIVETTLDLEGVDVHGKVLDAQNQPVAGAGIWLTVRFHTDWRGGRVLTHTDQDGTFRVRSIPADQCLGALAPGYAPSPLVDLDDVDTKQQPVRVRLVVGERGGAVTGTVRDAEGKLIEGADVCLGKQPRWPQSRHGSNTYMEVWTPLLAKTDKAGRFHFASVAAGEHPIAVRAAKHPFWHGSVTVQVKETAVVDVPMDRGVTVRGLVTDGSGQPIGGAVVRAYDRALDESFVQSGQYDYESVFGFPFTSADQNGRYRIENIAPGAIHMYATRVKRRRLGEPLMRAKTVLSGEAGDELTWDAKIDRGRFVTGLVTYENGTPMKYSFIRLKNVTTEKDQSITTNKDGRFTFTNLDPGPYEVHVQYPFGQAPRGTPSLYKTGVWPDRGEVRLVATFNPPKKEVPGKVRGRVQDAGNRHHHPGTLGVLLRSAKNWWKTGKADTSGRFEFGRVEPGRFRLIVMSGEQQIHTSDWFQVEPAQTHDVGTLLTKPGGAIRFRIPRGKGTEQCEPRLRVRCLDNREWRTVKPGTATEMVAKNFSVGRYEIQVSGKGFARSKHTTTVRADAEAVVEVPLRFGVERTFHVTWTKAASKLNFTILDEKEKEYWAVSFQLSSAFPNPYKPKLYLPPGRYKVRATSPEGHTVEREVHVEKDDAAPPAIAIDMQQKR